MTRNGYVMERIDDLPSSRRLTERDLEAVMRVFGFHDVTAFRAFISDQQRKQDRRAR